MAKRFARTPSGKPRSFVSLNQPTAPLGARGQKKKGADDMQSKQNLQDLFLLRAKRDRVPVTPFPPLPPPGRSPWPERNDRPSPGTEMRKAT